MMGDMYRTLLYPAASALLVAAFWQNAFIAPRAFAAERPDAPLPEITPQQLADDVRKELSRYSAAYLEAEFDEERNARALMGDEQSQPEMLRWPGKLKYAGDGRRWRAELESKSISFVADRPGDRPRANAYPRREAAGFDGERHYTSSRYNGSIVGQENLELARQSPADLFWASLNSSDSLLATLTDPRTRIIGQELHDGFRCYCAEFAAPDGKYRQTIVISPRQSHLARSVEQRLGDALNWSHELKELKRSENDLWYPGNVVMDWRTVNNEGVSAPFIRREIRVVRFEPGHRFNDDAFRCQPAYGQRVLDYTTGTSWFHDPWWPDVEPVLAKNNWPRPDLTPLNELASQHVPKLEDQPPPAVAAAQWINSKPIEWQQLAGQVTVVYFFGGRLTEPTPQQLAALRRLHELYYSSGMEVVAIAASTDRPNRVEQLAAELDLRFPIAIDAPVENGPGKTFRAFGLETSPATFLIDRHGKLHHVLRDMVPAFLGRLLKEAGVEDLPRLDTQNRPWIPDQGVREVAAVWPEMVRQAPHAGRISGRITDGDRAIAGADATAKLQLRVLSTPSARQTVTTPFKADNDFRAISDANGAYEIGGLPKGIYEVTFASPGKARVERQAIIKPDLSAETLDVVFDQDDGIAGRVVDEAGQPVAGARLHPRDWHFDRENLGSYKSGSLGVEDASTNERGEFALDKLYQGAWSLEVTAEGFVTRELAKVPPGTSGHVVMLKRVKAAKP